MHRSGSEHTFISSNPREVTGRTPTSVPSLDSKTRRQVVALPVAEVLTVAAVTNPTLPEPNLCMTSGGRVEPGGRRGRHWIIVGDVSDGVDVKIEDEGGGEEE